MLTLIQDCHPEELVAGGRHLTSSALDELVNSLVHWSFCIAGLDEHDAASVELSSYVVVSTHSETPAPPQPPPLHHAIATPQPSPQVSPQLVQPAEQTPTQSASQQPEQSPEQTPTQQSPPQQLHSPQQPLPIVTTPDAHAPPATPPSTSNITRQDEDEINFLLELLLRIAVDNKYRLTHVWPLVHRHLRWTLFAFGSCLVVVERAIIAIMRVTKLVIELHAAELDQLFERVVFPLLHDLLNIVARSPEDLLAAEELRVRAFQWAVRLILSHAE